MPGLHRAVSRGVTPTRNVGTQEGQSPQCIFSSRDAARGTTGIARRGAVVAGSGLLLASLAAFTVGAQSASSAVSCQKWAEPHVRRHRRRETWTEHKFDNNIVQGLAVGASTTLTFEGLTVKVTKTGDNDFDWELVSPLTLSIRAVIVKASPTR